MSWNKIIIEIVLFVLIGCIGMSLIMPVSALQKEFPDKVIHVKEDKNIVYFTMCFEGTVKVCDSDSKWGTKDIITEYSMATGFHGSRSGHIFIPAHSIEYSDDEAKEMLLREYIMSSRWFDDKKILKDKTYLEYYYSDDAEQYFNELKELDDEIEIVDIRPIYRVYCPREEGSLPLKRRDIVFDGSTEDKDIVIFKTKVADIPLIFNNDFKYEEEGTKLYIIHYAEHTIYDYVDEIVKDRETCPSEYKDVLTKAKEEMFEKIKDRGADIESGYLGSTTRPWRATPATYRFTGCTPLGSSGAPVLDENGRCVGMIACGPELIKGVVDPTNAYFIPNEDLEEASMEAGFELPIPVSTIEKISGNKLYIVIGIIMTIIGIIGLIKKVVVKKTVIKKISYVTEKIRGIESRRSKK